MVVRERAQRIGDGRRGLKAVRKTSPQGLGPHHGWLALACAVTQARAQKGPALGLMPYCRCPEMLTHFLTRAPAFSFCTVNTGLQLYSWSCPGLNVFCMFMQNLCLANGTWTPSKALRLLIYPTGQDTV